MAPSSRPISCSAAVVESSMKELPETEGLSDDPVERCQGCQFPGAGGTGGLSAVGERGPPWRQEGPPGSLA